ncbi:uncharacterized protein TNCT_138341 [Trichonephila clavata]|uniref:Uncharacterized protein n=1 Tax=Trichonephila clavata TaxID=2740835 RepID=A0A8X6FR04_TRICU|nr:uncharacterized protein TNCT_138341 [Trichonephila clavata]
MGSLYMEQRNKQEKNCTRAPIRRKENPPSRRLIILFRLNSLILFFGWIGYFIALWILNDVLYFSDESLLKHIAYNGFGAILFSCCMGWVFHVCTTKQMKLLSRSLSLKIFFPFSRLSFAAYLINFMVILQYLLSSTKQDETFYLISMRLGYSNTDTVGSIVEDFIESAPIEYIKNKDSDPTFLSFGGATSHPDLMLAHSNLLNHTYAPTCTRWSRTGQLKKFSPFWNKELQTLKENRDKARNRAEFTGMMSDCIGLLKQQACLRRTIKEVKRQTYRGFVENLDFRRDALRVHLSLSSLSNQKEKRN